MPRGLEKWQKLRNHNFSRQRRYRAPFSFALQSDYSQYPSFDSRDPSLLGRQWRIGTSIGTRQGLCRFNSNNTGRRSA
jgi:hypothetical protein